MCLSLLLEFQSAFARRFGQSLEPPVIDVAAAIEDDIAQAYFPGPRGDAPRSSLSMDEADASVRPAPSSMIWA